MRALPGQEKREPPGPQLMGLGDRALEQRRRIMRVTTQLVAKRGYQATTAELIVGRAKIGYGTFYKYFPDKEAVLLAIYDETFATTSAKMAEVFRGDGSSPWADRVGATIRCYYEAIASDPALWRVCLVEAMNAGPRALERQEESIKTLGAIFAQGRKLAKESTRLPETLENTVAGGIVWIAYERLVVGEAESLTELVAEAVQFALSPYLGEAAAIKAAKRAGERQGAGA